MGLIAPCLYSCVCLSVSVHVFLCFYVGEYVFVCVFFFLDVCVCVCVCAYMYACVWVSRYVYVCTADSWQTDRSDWSWTHVLTPPHPQNYVEWATDDLPHQDSSVAFVEVSVDNITWATDAISRTIIMRKLTSVEQWIHYFAKRHTAAITYSDTDKEKYNLNLEVTIAIYRLGIER